VIDIDYVMGFLKSKGEDETKDNKPKKSGMIMVISLSKPKKIAVKKNTK
tara:strand:+ start:1752 stop:1898 length:147 start_codon:yes stop_codon:yes gene_type:complete